MRRFVILAVPRTGSNLLCTLLNSHAQILCHHEVFNPQGVFTALESRGRGLAETSIQQRDADPLAFLDRVWQTVTDQSCVGFKWTRGQNSEVFSSVVGDHQVKKIVLRRRNRIKTFVSDKIAQQTQQWEVYEKPDLLMPRPRIHVDIQELLEHIHGNHRFYSDLSAELSVGGQPFHELEYENLLTRESQQRLMEYLEVATSDVPLKAASIKQNSTDLRDSISNFAELAAELADRELIAELRDRGI